MSDSILKYDTNFKIETEIQRTNIKFHSVFEPQFSIHGVSYENGEFVRMPDAAASAVSEAVHSHSKHTAGGRIRFFTNSPYLILKAKYPSMSVIGQMTILGRCGFDVYVDYGDGEVYKKSFIPTLKNKEEYEGVIDFQDKNRPRTVTVNMPLTGGINEIYLGLWGDSILEPAPDYKIKTPFVFYGSSITHGGCASRPGNCYTSMISRKYGADHLNLGFSGSAKGEDAIADYVASLDMSIFFYDYDYNAPTAEHYRDTHEKMFLKVRGSHPTLPIIIATRPKYNLNEDELLRLSIARETYERAKASGDENVYFIDGRNLMDIAKEDGTVDGTHPNDFGFYNMTVGYSKVIDEILLKMNERN